MASDMSIMSNGLMTAIATQAISVVLVRHSTVPDGTAFPRGLIRRSFDRQKAVTNWATVKTVALCCRCRPGAAWDGIIPSGRRTPSQRRS
ncbi:hypothetical protein [Streptomyces sp. A30]|uniref:hypothetical protein n=1 Tax=Streptomyces sp. A30 TaxID=2789273 RepID=UPI00398064D2